MDELEGQSSASSAAPLPNNEELIAALMQQVTSLSAQVAQLRNSGAASAAAPAAAPVYVPVRAPEPKCADPEPFKGDKKELTAFLVKCQLKFEGEPSRFSTEDARVRYTCGYLGGDVFKWLVPRIQAKQDSRQPNPPELESFQALSETLTKVYGDPNLARNVARELRALKQTGSVATYITKFGQLTPYVNHNDGSFMDQFFDGLKEEIKDEVARVGYFNTLTELQDFAVRLDSRLYDRQLQKRNLHANPTPPRDLTLPRSQTFHPSHAKVSPTTLS